MSLAAPVTYFRTVMNALSHKEHKDAFNDENIPSTALHRSYHLYLEQASIVNQNQSVIEVLQPIRVRLFVKGYRDPWTGRETALGYADSILKSALAPTRRHTQTSGIKNVTFISGQPTELSIDNDNVIQMELNFNCLVLLSPD
jgi:hypothetical protein